MSWTPIVGCKNQCFSKGMEMGFSMVHVSAASPTYLYCFTPCSLVWLTLMSSKERSPQHNANLLLSLCVHWHREGNSELLMKYRHSHNGTFNCQGQFERFNQRPKDDASHEIWLLLCHNENEIFYILKYYYRLHLGKFKKKSCGSLPKYNITRMVYGQQNSQDSPQSLSCASGYIFEFSQQPLYCCL